MADTPTPPAPSKAIVFARRSASTLGLWALVTAIFVSRWSWAYLGLIGVLAIIATVEYFRMLRAADVKCFPRFGILLAVAYCGALHASLLRGQAPPAGSRRARHFHRAGRGIHAPTPLSDPRRGIIARGGGERARLHLHRRSFQLRGPHHLRGSRCRRQSPAPSENTARSCWSGCSP